MNNFRPLSIVLSYTGHGNAFAGIDFCSDDFAQNFFTCKLLPKGYYTWKILLMYLKLRGKVFPGKCLKKFWMKSFGQVNSGEWMRTTSPSSLAQKLTSKPQLWTIELDGRHGKRYSNRFCRGCTGCHCRVLQCRAPYKLFCWLLRVHICSCFLLWKFRFRILNGQIYRAL